MNKFQVRISTLNSAHPLARASYLRAACLECAGPGLNCAKNLSASLGLLLISSAFVTDSGQDLLTAWKLHATTSCRFARSTWLSAHFSNSALRTCNFSSRSEFSCVPGQDLLSCPLIQHRPQRDAREGQTRIKCPSGSEQWL